MQKKKRNLMKKLRKLNLFSVIIFSLCSFCFLSSFINPQEPVSAKPPKQNKKSKRKVDPKAFHLVQLAVEVASKGDYSTAAAYLERALIIEPKYPDALFNAGSIYRVQKRYEDAYFVFQQLLSLNPYDHEARLEKVLSLIELQNYQKANSELKKVPTTQPRYELVKRKLQFAIANRPKKLQKSTPAKERFYQSAASASKLSLRFSSPTGIAQDSNNNIYVADFLTNKIEKISANRNKREVFASGQQIMGPSGLAFDDKKNSLLVSNYKSGTVVSINQLGEIDVLVKNLEKPYSIFLDETGNLYISEQGKKAVSIINIH